MKEIKILNRQSMIDEIKIAAHNLQQLIESQITTHNLFLYESLRPRTDPIYSADVAVYFDESFLINKIESQRGTIRIPLYEFNFSDLESKLENLFLFCADKNQKFSKIDDAKKYFLNFNITETISTSVNERNFLVPKIDGILGATIRQGNKCNAAIFFPKYIVEYD